jgi:ribose 5-phosphate isomerase RpiB
VGAADTVVETKTEDSFTYNDEKVVHSYGEAEQPLMVLGDTSGVGLAVPELKK